MVISTNKAALLRYALIVSEPPTTINEAVPLDLDDIVIPFIAMDTRKEAYDEFLLWVKQEGLTIDQADIGIRLRSASCVRHGDMVVCRLMCAYTGRGNISSISIDPLMTLPHMKYYMHYNLFNFRPELINVSTK